MADGKVVIETDLDSSGIEKGISKLGSLTTKGLKTAATTITGTAVALEGIGIAAVKAGSDFEAQMSRVKAISGATGAEFEKLKDQAIQLGADTSFSASQAAEGMENLAAAGFTTNEIMEAMPGLLDMAAASGEDLANSSEIAASTLRGFGLEAEEAGHVADVLAENANRTNAAVSGTGEAMKYVAPLARAAGISFEETAAAIGIMANAGIKGSQAGTTLRGAISRLSKPTDDMRDAMEELGISFYDSNGKMKSLSEQVGMLEGAFSGMTDEQKNNYLVTLYGQEALSGMLALINEGQGSLTDLTKSYENCDGSAKKAADTMRDNLKGAIDELGGSAESLGIVFYEEVSGSLKDTAESATESINNITKAFQDGGMEAAIDAAGDEFANLAVKAAEHAPDMVDVAIDFIQSFTDGIVSNRKKLLGAAGDIAETLAGGLADLLPDELERPVDEAIDAISDSLNSGGLKKAGKTLVTTFDNLVDAAGNLAEKALPPLTKGLDLAAENLDVLAASAAAAFTAFKGYKVVKETSSVLSKGTKAWKAASDAVDVFNAAQLIAMESGIKSNATLTAGQTVIGLLTGKITLATAAQTAWNAVMNANPIGLVITAVGALAAGLTVYKLATDDSKESQYALTEEQKKANEEIHKQYEAYKELDSARKESMENINAEYGYLTQLKDELQGLLDSNGQVIEGYEDRANFIVNQLSEALGIEKEKIWEIIQANGDLGASIDQIIEKKKAEAILNANEEAYTAAIKEKDGALKRYTDSLSAYDTAQKNYNNTQEAANKVMDEYYSLLKISPEAANGYLLASNDILKAADEAKAAFEEQKKKTQEAEETYVGYISTIQNYEGLSGAIISGDATKISEAMLNVQNSFITAEKGTKTSLENQVKNMQENYAALKQAVEDGVPGVTQSMVDGAQQMVEKSKIELDKFQESAKESTGKAGNSAAQGFAEKTPAIVSAVEIAAQSAMEKLNSKSPEFQQSGKNSGDSLNQGLSSTKPAIDATSQDISNSLNEKLGSADTQSTGARKTSEYNLGLGSNKGQIDITSKNIAKSSVTLLGSENTKNTGAKKSSEYNSGLGSNKSAVDSTSKTLSNTANKSMGSSDTGSTGKKQSSKYVDGILSKKSASESAGKSLANKADSGAKSVDGSSAGSGFGSGFVSGINSWIGSAVNAAANLAASALAAAKNFLGIHSPSREMKAVGKYFGQGFEQGIEGEEKQVQRTSENLSRIALESMDMSAITERMHEVMAMNTNRVTRQITSQNIHVQHAISNDSNRLSEREAKIIGKAVADVVNEHMEEFKIVYNNREFGRAVREVRKS